MLSYADHGAQRSRLLARLHAAVEWADITRGLLEELRQAEPLGGRGHDLADIDEHVAAAAQQLRSLIAQSSH